MDFIEICNINNGNCDITITDSNSNSSSFSDKLLRRQLAKERRKAKKISRNYNYDDGDASIVNGSDSFIYSCHNLHVHGTKQRYNTDDNSNDYNNREIMNPLLLEEALEFYNEGMIIYIFTNHIIMITFL